MTVIIGYRLNDKVIFATDSVRPRAYDRANRARANYNINERIVLVRPSIAVAAVGPSALCEAAVTAIRCAIFDTANQPERTLTDTITCCRDHFCFLYEQSRKYNPQTPDFLVFLLGGTDPETGESFLFSFHSRDAFQKSENLNWIVCGPSQEEMFVRNLMVNQMQNIGKLNDQGMLLLFADFIKTASGFSHAVSSNCYGMFVGDFPCKEVRID